MNRHNSEEVRQKIISVAEQVDPLLDGEQLNGVRFTFIAPSEEAFNELSMIIHDVEALGHNMRVLRGALQDFKEIMDAQDFIVTAGNSFGHLTGGLDGALGEMYPDLIVKIPATIALQRQCELNVGDGIIVRRFVESVTEQIGTYKEHHIVYTPTMRTPRRLPKGTDVPYLATRKALSLIQHAFKADPQQRNVFMPLMGTGTGNIPHSVAAQQFLLALRKATAVSNIKKLFDDGKEIDHAINKIWSDYNAK